MGKVTKYGRDFNFDDNVPEDTQNQRIQSWMQMHAPKELESGAVAAGTPAPATTPASTPSEGSNFNPKLAGISRLLLQATPLGALTLIPGVNERLGDVNLYRTMGQGALPFADEATAGVRSVLPTSWGGADYDTALGEERKGVKDYAEKHGELESMLLQGLGAAATIPLTMGAGAALQGTRGGLMAANLLSKAPKAAELAALAAKYPKIAATLKASGTGAGYGAVGGFGAGEGDFENRLENAGEMGAAGAVLGPAARGVMAVPEYIGGKLFTNNRVANFLRNQLPRERSSAYDNMPNMPRTATGAVDVSHPDFANMSADELKNALQLQRTRSMDIAGQGNPGGKDVLAADVLPGTTETVLQLPGEETSKLTKQIVRRQFDPELPLDQQAGASQHGQVKKWFDRVFGGPGFRDTETQLMNKLETDASTMFHPSYQHNIVNHDIANAMDNIEKLEPAIIERAKKWADSEVTGPRGIGFIDRAGNQRNYNTQYLHDIKRSIDAQIKLDPSFDTRVVRDNVKLLNKGMKDANPQYKDAMEKYGDTSSMIEALRKGREDVFGKNVNELDKGLGRQDIDAFMNDPDNSDMAKKLFRIGGARSLESKLLGSDATKFGANWADVLNNPNMVEKYSALLPPGKQSEWPHMVAQIRQLSDRRKAMEGALGNSKTASRQQRVAELNDPNVLGELVATGVNPHAPSTWRNWWNIATNPQAAGRATANETAKILGGAGQAGNNAAVENIRNLLSRYQGREAKWDARKGFAQRWAPYSDFGTDRQYNPQSSSQYSTRQ